MPTILPKVKAALGSRKIVSRMDVEKINRLYECPQGQQQAAATPGRTQRPAAAQTPTPRPKVTLQPKGHTPAPGSSLWQEFKHSVKGGIKDLIKTI